MLSSKDSPRGKLLSQYVCARIIRMDDVDIGLFDYDRHNTLYYFALNADEQIYLRYGGRDPRSADSYLNLESLERALEQGLQLHRRYQKGELPRVERPKAMSARQFPMLVERTYARGACVECHLIADYQNLQREQDGALDRITQMYRSPDIKTLGIHLDVPKGLLMADSQGAVQAAGLQAGDRITKLNGTPVWTFADLQYQYDKVNRRGGRIQLGVERGGEALELAVALPRYWWWTEIGYRHWSVDPRVYFESRPLTGTEKRQYDLDPNGFASEVTSVDSTGQLLGSHDLHTGDIVFAVDGVPSDEIANTAELFIKLRKTAGDTVTLDVIRGGQRMQMPLKTFRMSFRK